MSDKLTIKNIEELQKLGLDDDFITTTVQKCDVNFDWNNLATLHLKKKMLMNCKNVY
ncbi:hypothetical protein [Candidatus Uabimicrobium sp. HlEnr_7]|uniref:hypothetical protein n=1 Tax=Candidatus Uabimicrobium helgolandensis TaxID=3095367 RepID=UPI003555F48A